MKTNEKNFEQAKPEDKVIFAPIEEIQSIHSVIDKLEITRKELQKVVEGIKPIGKECPASTD